MTDQVYAVIGDVEATGTDFEVDQVVESAFLSLPGTPLEFMRAPLEGMKMVHSYFGHTAPMKLGALNTHHIMPSKLDGLPLMEVPAKLPTCNYLIGHNIDFDRKMLGAMGPKPICTLALAREYFPELDSHAQGAVLYHLGRITNRGEQWACDLLKAAHSADADVLNCARILKYVIYMIDRDNDVKGQLSWEDIYQASMDARIPKVMTFGEFKGRPVGDVRTDWAEWYAGRDNADPFLLIALRRAGKIPH